MILRGIVAGAAVALLLAALASVVVTPASWPLLAGAALLAAGSLFERWRYARVDAAAPGAGWRASGERFVDPESGRLVRVFFDPASGARRYVDGGDPPRPPGDGPAPG